AIILLLLVLLPLLLIAGGVGAAAVGSIGLLRGSVLRFHLANRASSTVGVLSGLAAIGAWTALAVAALPSATPHPAGAPLAAHTAPTAPAPIPTPMPTTPVPPRTTFP